MSHDGKKNLFPRLRCEKGRGRPVHFFINMEIFYFNAQGFSSSKHFWKWMSTEWTPKKPTFFTDFTNWKILDFTINMFCQKFREINILINQLINHVIHKFNFTKYLSVWENNGILLSHCNDLTKVSWNQLRKIQRAA